MTCATVRELLLDYIEAALPGDEREAVAAHLAVCEACRAEEAALRWADQALAPLAVVEEAPAAGPSEPPWLRAGRPVWWWTAAAAAGVLVLALLLSQRQPGPPTPAQANRRQTAPAVPRPAPTRAPALPELSATGQGGRRAAAVAPEDAGGPPVEERRRSMKRRQGPSGAVEEPASVAVVIVEPGTAPLLRSSYQAEVALPDGATSALTQSISRDENGTPREIAIAYAQRAADARRGE